jgi:RNA polymerase sigma-70 factor (ECF subfamily)
LGELHDERIARAFAARRAEGLEVAYGAYATALFSVARHILRNDDDAQDCVHDVLLHVWRTAGSYRRERGSLRAYLMVCIRNEALTRLRNEARHRKIEVRAAASTPETYEFEVRDVVESDRLRRALAALAPDQRAALALAYAGNLSHREIAERLDAPLGTIKSRLALGLRRLKSMLGAQEATV